MCQSWGLDGRRGPQDGSSVGPSLRPGPSALRRDDESTLERSTLIVLPFGVCRLACAFLHLRTVGTMLQVSAVVWRNIYCCNADRSHTHNLVLSGSAAGGQLKGNI